MDVEELKSWFRQVQEIGNFLEQQHYISTALQIGVLSEKIKNRIQIELEKIK